MFRSLALGLLSGLLLSLISATASAVGPCCCFCQAGQCSLKVEREDVDVKVFDVECETICIPPIRFPWQCGPIKRCGRVRVIKNLVTDKVQKPVCVYEWSAIACCPDCRRRVMCPPPRQRCCEQDADQGRTLMSAIRQSPPDGDGWIVIPNQANSSLSVGGGLIETEVEDL